MKILTWNVERLKHSLENIRTTIESFNADIVVLTETSSKLQLNNTYKSIATKNLPENLDRIQYKNLENRTTIWTKYDFIKSYKTQDEFTSVCAEIDTEFGNLKVFGTIIGVLGGKGERFQSDLNKQILDFTSFTKTEFNCIIGDLNVMFSGYAYPSHHARNRLNATFDDLQMKNLTATIANNVDHIILSKSFLENKTINVELFNADKKLSDHIGICVTIS